MNETQSTTDETMRVNALVGDLAIRIRKTLIGDESENPATILEWLGTQPEPLVKQACIATQPKGWSGNMAMLVDSMTPDQRVGILAALAATYVQAM